MCALAVASSATSTYLAQNGRSNIVSFFSAQLHIALVKTEKGWIELAVDPKKYAFHSLINVPRELILLIKVNLFHSV